jgi:lambda family phage tail tape measure protein
MADQTVNIRLKIDDEGDMRRRTQDAKEYNKEINKGSAAMSSMQYGQARGASGLTGASARDFASEQQGLGGLVRLYATVAANTYAATAAFKALSDAMNTENMVKGLDQLGARSGMALGTLASNMVKATGGAISLKEAMTATAQGTSAGLTSAQMLKLTEVAQKASLVLGVDVTDALSRLSRGVTKLEPELLDELGIFTKIGPATEEYARKLGKTTGQLTDFEKRQAFANAVLKEGSDKFNNIDIPANPYKQLEASLKDIAQSTLSLLNTALSPFANLLANNIGLLTAALVGIGFKLTKMAVPALGNWQKSLIDSAELAKLKAKEISDTFLDIDFKKINAEFQVPILKGMAQSIEDELQAAQQAFAKAGTRDTAIGRGLTSEDKNIAASTLATLDLAKAQKEVNYSREKANVLLNKEETTGIALTASEQERLKIYLSHASALQTIVTLKEREILINSKLAVAEEAALNKFEHGSSIIQNLSGKARAKIYTDAAARAERLGIVSEVGKTTEKAGIIAGMEALTEKLTSSRGLSGGATLLTRIQGTMAAVGTEAGIAATALSGVGTALMGAYIGYEILAPLLSKNQKEELAFAQAVDTARQSMENVNRVVAELDKGLGGFIPSSIAGINALATAFTELSSQMELVNEKAIDSKKAMNWFDKIGDWFKSLSFVPFVKGQDQKFAEVFSEQIESGLKLLKNTGLRDRAEAQLKESLGIDKLDKAGIEKAVEKLGVEGVQKVIDNFKEIGQEAANSSSRLKDFKSAAEATTKSYQEFIQSTAVNDPVFRLGASLQNLGSVMNKLRTGEIDEIKAAMLDISKTPEIGMLFGPEFVNQLIKVRGELISQVNLDTQVSRSMLIYEERIAGLKKELEDTGYKQGQSGTSKRQQGLMARLKEAEKERSGLVKYTVDLSSVKKAEDLFNLGLREALTSGSKLIEQGLQNASEQAALTIAKARVGGLIGGEKALEEGRIALEGLQIQRRAINTNIQLILSNQQLTASIDEANALSSLAEAKQGDKSSATISRLEEGVQVAQIFKELINKSGVNFKNYKQFLPEGTSESVANQIGIKIQGTSLAIAGQEAALIKNDSEQTATAMQTQRNYIDESVKLTQRQVGYDQTLFQLLDARQGIYSNILGYATEEMVVEQNKLETNKMFAKQGLELLEINAEIAKAASEETRDKLTAFKTQIGKNQLADQENIKLGQSQKITMARIQLDQRIRADAEKRNQLFQEQTKLELQAIDLKSQGLIYLSDELVYEKNRLENGQLYMDQLIRRNTIEGELSDLRKQEAASDNAMVRSQLAQRIANKVSELTTVENIQKEETKLLAIRQEQARISNNFARENFQRENDYSALERNLKYRQQDVQLDSELLQISSQVNLLTVDEISKQEKILKLKELELAFEEKLTQAQRTRAAELSKIKEDEQKAMAAGPLRPDDQKTFEDRRKQANLTYSDELKAASRANDAKKQGVDLQYSMNERMKAYEQSFVSAFDRMGDAMVEFAKTGKLNFKDMINSLIADLIKFEIKQQAMSQYKIFRPEIMSAIGGFNPLTFGFQGFLDARAALASANNSGYGVSAGIAGNMGAAKGKAFDAGYEVHRFAMGGAFTNQVVGSPTLFKFASGTGLMGEAGPEAIMPLKRDGSGNLGVRSQPSNVSVVVNNHSGQPATTNETIDSRGNRSIEVIVGDVVAQQIATKNSPVQQSMSSTYGSSPALVRR